MKKFLISNFLFFSFFVGSFVLADEIAIDYLNEGGTGYYFNPISFQTFVATERNITAISLNAKMSESSGTRDGFEFILCKGDEPTLTNLYSGTYPNRSIHCDGDDQLLGQFLVLNLTTTYAENILTFSDTIETQVGDEYYFAFQRVEELDSAYSIMVATDNPYPDGKLGGIASQDLNFRVYYDPSYRPDSADWTYDLYQLSTSEPDIFCPLDTMCFVGEECRVTCYHNELAIGAIAHFIWTPTIDGYDTGFPEHASYSQTLQAIQPLEETFIIASSSAPIAATTTEYGIYLESQSGLDRWTGGFAVNWYVYDDLFPPFEIVDPCATVASSTGTFADDFRYGLECGVRSVVAWVFVPSDTAFSRLGESFNNLATSFPFSYFTQIIQTFQSVLSENRDDPTIITLNAVLPTEYQSLNSPEIFNPQILANGWGTLWTENIYPLMSKIMYVLTFFYFVNRFLGMARKDTEQNDS